MIGWSNATFVAWGGRVPRIRPGRAGAQRSCATFVAWVGSVPRIRPGTAGAQRSCATFVAWVGSVIGLRPPHVAGAIVQCSGPQDDRRALRPTALYVLGPGHYLPSPAALPSRRRTTQTIAETTISHRWPSTSPTQPQRSSGHPAIARPPQWATTKNHPRAMRRTSMWFRSDRPQSSLSTIHRSNP